MQARLPVPAAKLQPVPSHWRGVLLPVFLGGFEWTPDHEGAVETDWTLLMTSCATIGASLNFVIRPTVCVLTHCRIDFSEVI